MLRTILFFVLLALPLLVRADRHTCMTKAEADALAKKLRTEGYIFSFCDCCMEVQMPNAVKNAIDNDLSSFTIGAVNIMKISKVTVKPCPYDDDQFAVEVDYIDNAMSYLVQLNEDHQATSVELISMSPMAETVSTFVTLNYHWAIQNGKSVRLGLLIDPTYEASPCIGFEIPDADIWDNDYRKWFNKRNKKPKMPIKNE